MWSLIPWRKRDVEPSENPVATFRREFDDLLDRFFSEPLLRPGRFTHMFSPALDFLETDEELIVKGEFPGIEAKDIDINLTGNTLTIRGEKKEEKEEKGERYHRVERSFGSFSRSFTLPCEVEEDKVSATYKDGVLTLKLPKCPAARKKTVKIDVK